MDEVLADFTARSGGGRRHPPIMYEKGFFENLEPMDGALKSVRELLDSELFRVEILTQPVANSTYSYTEKANWIAKYLPELTYNLNLTQDKTLFKGDYLIDDSIKWGDFEGEFLLFNPINSRQSWEFIVEYLINKHKED